MKKILSVVLILSMVAFTAPAFALLDDNSTNANASAHANGGNATGGSSYVKDSGNSSVGNGFGNFSPSSESKSTATNFTTNNNRNTNTNRNMQAQGQLQGQKQSSKATANGTVTVGGDSYSEKHIFGEAIAASYPGAVAQSGQEASTVYTLFGGIGRAESAEYKVCIETMQTLDAGVKSGFFTQEFAAAEAMLAYKQLKDSTASRRYLGIGPKTRGCHLLNLGGLLATDACQEFNSDNWFGIKNIKTQKAK